MNNLKTNHFRILVLALFSLGLMACQQGEKEVTTPIEKTTPVQAPNSNNSSDIIAEAKYWLAKAAEAKFEWSTTSILIDKAEQAEKAGNSELAIDFAKQAISESKNSLAQVKYSDEHWQDHSVN